MRKLRNKLLTVMMAFALVCTMGVNPMAVYAAEVAEPVEEVKAVVEVAEQAEVVVVEEETESTLSVEPRAHVSYYPTSGANSGYFYGVYSSSATYNLPAGQMKISYSISGAGTCYLRFYSNGTLMATSGALSGNATGNSSVTLPWSGTYTVKVYYPNGNASTEVIYAFSLYTE